MAEFIDVIHTIQQICKQRNGQCPTCLLGEFACPNNARFDKTEEAAFRELEDVVVKWAEENPKVFYPRWVDWLVQVGVVGCETCHGHKHYFVENDMFEHIPEETAQLLGLKPVPVVHGDCGATNEADAKKNLGLWPKEGT